MDSLNLDKTIKHYMQSDLHSSQINRLSGVDDQGLAGYLAGKASAETKEKIYQKMSKDPRFLNEVIRAKQFLELEKKKSSPVLDSVIFCAFLSIVFLCVSFVVRAYFIQFTALCVIFAFKAIVDHKDRRTKTLIYKSIEADLKSNRLDLQNKGSHL